MVDTPAWVLPLAEALAPFPQLQLLVEATVHPSLPKALRLLRENGFTIDNSCSLYPAHDLPLEVLLGLVVGRGLAYAEELLPPATAQSWAQTLLSHIPPDSSWLTNAHWGHDSGGHFLSGWQPFTPHTFDAGFIWLAADSVGAIWAWAED
jgi:hypothetical protein